jgi:hypothetical protein
MGIERVDLIQGRIKTKLGLMLQQKWAIEAKLQTRHPTVPTVRRPKV